MRIYFISTRFKNIVGSIIKFSLISQNYCLIPRLIKDSKEYLIKIDTKYQRKFKAITIMGSKHVFLSSLQPGIIAHRLHTKEEVHE